MLWEYEFIRAGLGPPDTLCADIVFAGFHADEQVIVCRADVFKLILVKQFINCLEYSDLVAVGFAVFIDEIVRLVGLCMCNGHLCDTVLCCKSSRSENGRCENGKRSEKCEFAKCCISHGERPP